ncbi:MAG: T9SS type A sorting domain-containing protein [Candidatus Azobacteroides sp.]|nr:T9SS type A sorting domain-containing protein [Candidatus Azobacteroides sp.]
MKKMNTFQMICVLLLGCGFSLAPLQAQELPLPLDALNYISHGEEVAYDPTTHTITYKGGWQFAGWIYEVEEGKDFSAYDLVVIEFDASNLIVPPGEDEFGKIQLEVGYMDGHTNTTEVRSNTAFASVSLDNERKGEVKYIYLKSQYLGEITLLKAYAIKIQDDELPITGLNLLDTGVSLDFSTKTVSYTMPAENWSWIAWGFGDSGRDASAFTKVVIEFEPLEIEANITIQYNGKDGEHGGNTQPGATSLSVDLDEEAKGNVKNIFLKGKGTGSITIKRAYFATEEEGDIYELPLDALNLNSNGDINFYDPVTHTITYGGEWQYYGWTYEAQGGKDFSAYDLVVVEFDASDLPEMTVLELEIAYMNGEKHHATVHSNASFAAEALKIETKSAVQHIFVKSQNPGKLVLFNAYATKVEEDEFPLTGLNLLDGGVSFDLSTKTVSYTKPDGDWSWIAWGLGTPGRDCSAYSALTIEFEPLEIDANLTIHYNGYDPEQYTNTPAGSTSITLELLEDYKADVKNVFLKGKGTGTITIKRAYFEIYEEPAPDLIVTDIFWEPSELTGGEQVVFSAKIKNIGDEATPDDVKHGVAFSVNGKTVSWSDTYKSSMAPGEEVILTANGGLIAGENYWIAGEGKNLKYTIKAHVNDDLSNGIENEKDITNNTLEKDLIINPEADLIVTEFTWTPEMLVRGEEVTFTAVIKNQGYAATPDNEIHRVAFSVNGTVTNWNDEHLASIAPGEEVTLAATNGPDGKATWTCDISGNITFKAEVNDTGIIAESDTDNNTLEKEGIATSIRGTTADEAGNVYVIDGVLYIDNYSSAVTVAVYDLFGKLMANKQNVINNMPVDLPSGIYIIQVQEVDKKDNYKIVVK